MNDLRPKLPYMSKETRCGDCTNFVPHDSKKPERGGNCPKMLISGVFPNHPTLYTLESHGKLDKAIRLINDPLDTCFEMKLILTDFGEFTLLELLAEIEERKKAEFLRRVST